MFIFYFYSRTNDFTPTEHSNRELVLDGQSLQYLVRVPSDLAEEVIRFKDINDPLWVKEFLSLHKNKIKKAVFENCQLNVKDFEELKKEFPFIEEDNTLLKDKEKENINENNPITKSEIKEKIKKEIEGDLLKGERINIPLVLEKFKEFGVKEKDIKKILSSYSGNKRMGEAIYRWLSENTEENNRKIKNTSQNLQIPLEDFEEERKKIQKASEKRKKKNSVQTHPIKNDKETREKILSTLRLGGVGALNPPLYEKDPFSYFMLYFVPFLPKNTRIHLRKNEEHYRKAFYSPADSPAKQRFKFIVSAPFFRSIIRVKANKEVRNNLRKLLRTEIIGNDDLVEDLTTTLYEMIENKKKIPDNILLYGPPGVGKTSAIKGIGKCLAYMETGTMDNAEKQGQDHIKIYSVSTWQNREDVMGFHSTYNKAQEGFLANGLIRDIAFVHDKNSLPQRSLFCIGLDEVDKAGGRHNNREIKAALLEFLNSKTLEDAFLGAPFKLDMRHAIIIATANDIGEEGVEAFYDRFRRIKVESYTLVEKTLIALLKTIPEKAKEFNFVEGKDFKIEREALAKIVGFTRTNMSVRPIEQSVNLVMRYIYKEKEDQKDKLVLITPEIITKILDFSKLDPIEEKLPIGASLLFYHTSLQSTNNYAIISSAKGLSAEKGRLHVLNAYSKSLENNSEQFIGEEISFSIDSVLNVISKDFRLRNLERWVKENSLTVSLNGPTIHKNDKAALILPGVLSILSLFLGEKVNEETVYVGHVSVDGSLTPSPFGMVDSIKYALVNPKIKRIILASSLKDKYIESKLTAEEFKNIEIVYCRDVIELLPYFFNFKGKRVFNPKTDRKDEDEKKQDLNELLEKNIEDYEEED